jgi:H3 lysine-79-specific histone-lysine N-methyltransferase
VDLEYPNSGSKERCISLTTPMALTHLTQSFKSASFFCGLKSKTITIQYWRLKVRSERSFNVRDNFGIRRAFLDKTLQAYLTPIQQALFGPMPKGGPIFDWRDKYSPRRTDMKPPGNKPQADYLLAVQNAIETHDGPAFLHAFTAINSILQQLKCSTSHPENALIQAVRGWSSLPKVVVLRVMTETYNRCVIPHWKELKQYQAFSSEVYGELMPSLVYKICQHTALGEHSLFVDLGSGVGNVVAQASLQTGCRSFGIEIQPNRASIACDAMNDFRARCHMWGLRPGEIELAEGDMRSNSRVHDLVKQADVVLVNNLIFEENR